MRNRWWVSALVFSFAIMATSHPKSIHGNETGQKANEKQRWRDPNPPSIKGITLIESSLTQVISTFGQPVSIRKIPSTSVKAPSLEELSYSGLVFRIEESQGYPPYPFVVSIDITGSEWNLYPAIRVGMTEGAVVDRLGPPDTVKKISSRQWQNDWPTPFKVASDLIIAFTDGRVSRILLTVTDRGGNAFMYREVCPLAMQCKCYRSSGVRATVDGQIRAGDIGRFRTSHERYQRGDLLHRSVAVERCIGLLGCGPIARSGI
jgi:hypothetical protein